MPRQQKSEEMKMVRRYNPDDYEPSLRENMIKTYEFFENGGKDVEQIRGTVINLYFDIKEAIKFREISPEAGKDMQEYFWGMLG